MTIPTSKKHYLCTGGYHKINIILELGMGIRFDNISAGLIYMQCFCVTAGRTR